LGRVLLADDDAISRKMLGFILTSAGHEVDFAANGLEALQRLRVAPDDYQVVITDHDMPDLSGLDLVRQLTWQGICLNRIVVISAQITAMDRFNFHELPIHSILDKPIRPNLLLGAVQSILDRPLPSRAA